jgi:hypothetical protein
MTCSQHAQPLKEQEATATKKARMINKKSISYRPIIDLILTYLTSQIIDLEALPNLLKKITIAVLQKYQNDVGVDDAEGWSGYYLHWGKKIRSS